MNDCSINGYSEFTLKIDNFDKRPLTKGALCCNFEQRGLPIINVICLFFFYDEKTITHIL